MNDEIYMEQPVNCPKCNSDEQNYHGLIEEGGEVWRKIDCLQCDFSWVEVFKFTYWEQ